MPTLNQFLEVRESKAHSRLSQPEIRLSGFCRFFYLYIRLCRQVAIDVSWKLSPQQQKVYHI